MTPLQDIDQAVEQFLSSSEGARRAALRAVTAALRAEAAAGRADGAAERLRRAIVPGLDYTSALSLHRVHQQLAAAGALGGQPTRLAILGSATTEQLKPLLELYLHALGVAAHIYEADYGVFRQEVLDPASALYAFEPGFVLLATTWRDLGRCPGAGDGREAVAERVASEVAEWSALWRTLHERCGCQIVQDSFAPPPGRLLGNHEMRSPGGRARFVAEVNRALYEQAPPYVTVHDVDHLSAAAGRWSWEDARFYHSARLPCAPEHLVDYAHSVASVLGAHLGLSRKCLVLDLDGTLWGGVIGDDGLGGIRLGQGDPEGEAFLAFQRYAKGLQLRGVLLAVCSKNEDATARAALAKHPEMVLRPDDFACIVANWADKATNLRAIATELNLGLEALAFVDDHPAERALVRRLAPEVAVPEMPEDPADYVQALARHRYFQVVSLAAEDLQRTRYYRANADRRHAQAAAGTVDDFLRSLDMVGRVEPVHALTLDRTVQLIHRSNQFNLTTRRHTAAEVAAMAADDRWIALTVSLADRFGDNGLISVLLAAVDDGVLTIDTWLMSCRVLKRTVEQFLLNALCRAARERGVRTIRGEYIPTARNLLVRDHYRGLGFAPADSAPDGHTWWALDLTDAWEPLETFVKE